MIFYVKIMAMQYSLDMKAGIAAATILGSLQKKQFKDEINNDLVKNLKIS